MMNFSRSPVIGDVRAPLDGFALSDAVGPIVARWLGASRDIAACERLIAAPDDDASLNRAPVGRTDGRSWLSEAQAVQEEALMQLCETAAETLNDLAVKLVIWKLTVMPDGDIARLRDADYLPVSAAADALALAGEHYLEARFVAEIGAA